MTTQSLRNKGQCSSVGPAQSKGKLCLIDTPRKRFLRNSEIECSAYPSGLLTYIVHPCTPSPLANRCQLVPPAPSLLAHELTPRRRCTSPSQLASAAAAAARSLCPGCPVHDTFCAATTAATSAHHQPLPPLPPLPPPLLPPTFPADRANAAPAAARGPFSGYPAPGTTYATAAAAPVAAPIPRYPIYIYI
jgi:hypothetical protein